MRLTLRTLLAYRDGVLDPKDSQDLEVKLRESSTARHISQRIDQSLRNPKLAPIPIDAKEPGFDANQIAEYLDDTIATADIPELERRCLENNALLSEVGSCHSILAKALTQAVEIPDTLRARIHALPAQPYTPPGRLRIERIDAGANRLRIDPGVASSSVGPVPSDSSHGTVEADPVPASRTERISSATMRTTPADARESGIELSEGLGNQVPEYLLGSDRSWLKNAVAVASLCIGLVVVGILALGPTDQLSRMLQPNHSPIVGRENFSHSKPIPSPTLTEQQPAEQQPAEKEQSVVTNQSAVDRGENGKAGAAASAPFEGGEEPRVAATESKESSAEPKPDGDASTEDAVPVVDTSTSRSEVASGKELDSLVDARKESAVREGAGVSSSNKEEQKAEGNIIQWLPESEESSSALVFLRESTEEDPQWRLARGGMKSIGGSWIVPTAQRTEFRIPGGCRAIVCGETELAGIVSPEPSVANPIAASISYGRLILFPSPERTSIHFLTNLGVLKIEFTDKDSSCAIDIRNEWEVWVPPVSVSKEVPDVFIAKLADSIQTTCVLEIIGLQGSLKASLLANEGTAERGTKVVEVGDRVQFRSVGGPVDLPLEKTPEWLRTSVERPIDQYASRDIAKALASKDVVATEALKQLLNHRRGETASMATRLLAQQGDFSVLVGAGGLLSRKGVFVHSATWLNKMANFVHSIDRIVEFVESFVQGEPDRAETLLRLMIPFNNAQLADGGDRFLVETLSSGLLDERTLAIIQLSELTGRTLSYHPEKNSVDSMQQWRKLLSKSEIRRSVAGIEP